MVYQNSGEREHLLYPECNDGQITDYKFTCIVKHYISYIFRLEKIALNNAFNRYLNVRLTDLKTDSILVYCLEFKGCRLMKILFYNSYTLVPHTSRVTHIK